MNCTCLNDLISFGLVYRTQGGGSHALWWKMQGSEQALVRSALESHVETARGVKARKQSVLEWEKIRLTSEKLISSGDQSTVFYEIEILCTAAKTLAISSSYLKGLKNHKSG